MNLPPSPGIYPCTVLTSDGPEAHCCLWLDGVWYWWFEEFDPPQWEIVTDYNCTVVAWELPMQHSDTVSNAVSDVVMERQRQRSKLGWTEAHDDGHKDGFLAVLAAAKALCATRDGQHRARAELASYFAAFDLQPERIYNGTFRDLLVEAGALIVAEIERIDRAAEREVKTQGSAT